MACTAIRTKNPKGSGTLNLKFMTVPKDENSIDLDIYLCDTDFIPTSTPEKGSYSMNEEEYHKALRSEANKVGEFVPEESTNPEWNGDTI